MRRKAAVTYFNICVDKEILPLKMTYKGALEQEPCAARSHCCPALSSPLAEQEPLSRL